jgi:DHA1 family multidrug resistance protein-like MFS transporter
VAAGGERAVLPIAPWLWMAATEPWHIILINIIAGVMWAANLLATFNIVLQIAPADKRPSYMGWQQAGIFFASFLGPLIGGFVIAAIGYRLVFFFSGAGRLLATLVLWRMVPDEPEAVELESPPPNWRWRPPTRYSV